MRTVIRASIAACSLLCLGQASIAQAPNAPAPTFADAVIPSNQARCTQSFNSTRSPDNRVLSVLRTVKTSKDKEFLAVGPGFGTHDRAECVIDVLFQQPLNASRTLSVDFRGSENKQSHTRASLKITLGSQTHQFAYAEGRWLDGAPGTDIKRFLLDVPAGTTKVRIKIAGSASTINKTDTALIGFDSLEMCFVDPDHPEYCGMAGMPNQHATK